METSRYAPGSIPLQEAPLTPTTLRALLDNEIGAVRVPMFATPEECRAFTAAASSVGFQDYEDVDPPIGRIGITQFEAKADGKRKYFAQASEATRRFGELASRAFDPVTRVVELLRRNGGADTAIAVEPGYGNYFAGLVRQINRGALLHIDFGPHDAPGWLIGEVDAQLAWNIYMTDAGSGGECTVHHRPWQVEDESFRDKESYGYTRRVITGAHATVLGPVVGDLTLFNTRNFHEVAPAGLPRMTVSSFVGRLPHGDLILWS